MSDLELLLRDELRAMANRAPVPAEAPEEIVRRVRRRRGLRFTTGAAACAAAIVVIGGIGAGLMDTADDSRLVVAGPGDDGPLDTDKPLDLGDPGELELRVARLPDSPLAAREDHSGVWTGTELIVWGGSSGNRVDGTTFGDGAAYNPATATWRSLGPSPLSPRARHAAVWTGTEMIVWGGSATKNGVGGLLDGAAYDPVTDRWRSITPAPGGSDRTYARAVMFDRLAVLAGGVGPRTGPAASTVLIYDPPSDAWMEHTAPFPVVAAAVVDGDLVLAGSNALDGGAIDLATFDPRTGTHEALPPFPSQQAADLVGLASTGSHLVAAVTSMEDTAVAVLDRTLGEWTATSTVDIRDFTPGVSTSGFAPGLDAWTGEWYLAWSRGEPHAIAPGTSRTVGTSAEVPCNANGAAVWTGETVLQWGGQACWADAPAPQVADGVEVTPLSG